MMDNSSGNGQEEEDSWWYVCTLCFQAFASDTKCRTHKRLVHGSKNAANVLILSQTADLEPRVKVVRCNDDAEMNIPIPTPPPPHGSVNIKTGRTTDLVLERTPPPLVKIERSSPRKQATKSSPPLPQQCKLCSSSFETSAQLRTHALVVHVPDRSSTRMPRKTSAPQVMVKEDFPLTEDEDIDETPHEKAHPQRSVPQKRQSEELCKAEPEECEPERDVAVTESPMRLRLRPRNSATATAAAQQTDSESEFSAPDDIDNFEIGSNESTSEESDTGEEGGGGGTGGATGNLFNCERCACKYHFKRTLVVHTEAIHKIQLSTDTKHEPRERADMEQAPTPDVEVTSATTTSPGMSVGRALLHRCGYCLRYVKGLKNTNRHVTTVHSHHITNSDDGNVCHCVLCYKNTFLTATGSPISMPMPIKDETVGTFGFQCKICSCPVKESGIQKHVRSQHPEQQPPIPLSYHLEAMAPPSEWRRVTLEEIVAEGTGKGNKERKKTRQTYPPPTRPHRKKKEGSKMTWEEEERLRTMVEQVKGPPYACPECYKSCPNSKTLFVHLRAHAEHIRRRNDGEACDCVVCYEDAFFRPSLLVEGAWECKLCGQALEMLGARRHVQRVHPDQNPQRSTVEAPSEWRIAMERLALTGEAPIARDGVHGRQEKKRHECSACGKSYSDRHTLKEHVSSVHNSKLRCPVCDKLCSSRSALKTHQTVHAESRDHLCPTCGSVFKSAGHLRSHMVYHDPNGRKYVCGVCTKAFYTNTSMHLHRRTHDAREVMCPECGGMFKSERALTSHRSQQHLKLKPYKCEKCDATFAQPANLKRHAGAHVEGTPHACPQCPKAFKTEYHLKDHTSVFHEGKWKQKVHICRICKQEFPGKQSVRRHELEAHNFQRGSVKFECKHCNAKFGSHFNYKQHQVVHTNERGFQCDHPGCDKTFDSAGHLKQHRVTHLPYDELPNVCDCGKRFGLVSQLRYHKKRIHEKEKQKSREAGQAKNKQV